MADEGLVVDFDEMELGELEDFEEVSELEMQAVLDGTQTLTVKAITALVWIHKRRSDPDFTLEDARKTKLSTVDFTKPTENPTEGGASS